jgi:hypothetical protein
MKFLFVAVIASMLLNAVPVIAADMTDFESSSVGRRKSNLPRLSVDTDPSKSGIQSSLRVVRGSFFMIDVVVTGIDPAKPLDVYQFNLRFNPKVLEAVEIVSWGFLPGGFIIQKVVTPADVSWAEGVLAFPGVSGDGILATITFKAIGNGKSRLDLRDAILAGLGEDITGRVSDGTVTALSPRHERSSAGPVFFSK